MSDLISGSGANVGRILRSPLLAARYALWWLSLFMAMCCQLDTASAQAYPTACKPLGTNTCVARGAKPYQYLSAICTPIARFPSEAAALAFFLAHPTMQPPSHCNLVTERLGWGTPSAQVYFTRCGGIGSYHPGFQYGIEITNASKYRAEWDYCSLDQHNSAEWAVVQRTRELQCPNGFTSSGGYCYRPSNKRDLHKNLGPQCPQCGNPISLGVGGKHQEEKDYTGSGRLPLEFSRHYNNLLTSSAWYSVTDYVGTLAERVLMASNPDEPGKQIIGMDRMGVLWRHSYQRGIVLRTTDALQTAAVYRPDGKVYAFNNYNGTFVGEADVIDSLVRLGDDTWRYTTAQGEQTEEYDANGRLTKISHRSGEFQVLAYDACNLLRTVTDSFGRTLTLDYTATCSEGTVSAYRVSSVTDPSGSVTSFGYDSNGRLTQVSYPDTTTRTYHYDGAISTELTGISDESNTRYISWTYDANRRANLSEGPGSAGKVSVVYSPAAPCTGCAVGTVTSAVATDANNNATTYTFSIIQGVNRLTAMTRPAGSGSGTATETYAYDANGNVINKKDFNGNRTCSAFDLTRNLETVRVDGFSSASSCPSNLSTYTPAAGTRQRKISTQWHANFRKPTQIDEPGKRTTFTHDANGNVLTRTELDTTTSESRTWTYTYDSFGQVLTVDGPRTDVTDVTTYSYYSCTTGYQCGQINTVTNDAGHVTTYNTYNAHGQPLTITDPNGVVTTLTYDLRRRLASRTVGTEATTFEYWPTGLLKKVTLPDTSYLQYTYDTARRLTDITDAEGNRIHYALDLMGNRTGEQAYDPANALTRTRTRVFDALNRLQKEVGAAGTASVTTTYGYDNNGNQTSIAAPLGRDTAQGYDELNRLTSVTDPLNGVTQYGYNALDQLISVTDPRNLATSYSYNALGDLKQQASPDSGITTNTYDSGGNLATSTDARSAVTTYTYDALNRVSTASFSSGSTTDQVLTYTYDAGTYGDGRLTGASDANHSLSWAYDDQGRVLTATQVVGSVSKTASYAYSNGLRQSMTTPSGQVITYGYANGKVTSISVNGTVVVSNILYDPFGPVRQWSWADGSLSVRTFDQDGKVAQIDSAGLKTYSYDDAFRITGITDTTNSALSWTYGYDDLDRLTSALKTGTTHGYTYDANGNRLTETGSNPSTFTIAANSNRLSGTAGALSRTYGYDDAGNTTSFTGVSFTYNNRGRMSSSTKSGVTTNYTYNALGQLVKKASSTLYYYDEAGHILGIYDGSGALTEEIVWLGDTPIATLRPQSGGGVAIYNIHTDHLNTPRVVTDSVSGVVRWRWDGDAFGGGAVNDDPSGAGVFEFSLRFPGQIAIVETGLNYNYYRDYDPSTGRYVQSDPIGLQGGINTYAYALSNPIRNVDSKGLWSTADLALAGHFYSRRGGYVDISAWCGDYVSDSMMKAQIQILKQKIDAAAQQLASLKGSTTFSIQQKASLYISTIYSFGAGDGHVQTADCEAEGDGCCVNVNCRLRMYAVDGYDDPLDLCQRYGICGSARNVGGVPFTFGLTCFSRYSTRACRR